MDNLSTGFAGEAAAQQALLQWGYTILDTNVRSGRWGELDVVCLEGGDLVFVEVKTRMNENFGGGVEAVTPGKLQRLQRAAQFFKLTHPETPDSMRFDVVVVDGQHRMQIYRNIGHD